MVRKFLNLFLQSICKHEFDYADLLLTHIPPPDRPGKYARLDDWNKYWDEWYNGDWGTKRVLWKCCKCGKIFYAHCRLDILKHGKAVRKKTNWR